ncbi:hypothetical protein AQUCO_01400149v1 [Aquilegia coerulea]|uniref:RCK N-terminal domain-containing protein n=1 Tax=Aquilegia coerulea TaxID=218851 RepID=A0A2G5DUT4_AQUCA|nr:hypothetical protein AQUCO_01400149v1 [Aquilegia coerulea]
MSKDDTNSNPNPNKPERPPVLKKSRTISEESRFNSTSNNQNSFQFPPVRRISTTPPSAHRFITNDPSSSSSSSDTNTNGGIYDRDWYYPSFLGPHTSLTRVNAKANKSPKLEFPDLASLRIQTTSNSVIQKSDQVKRVTSSSLKSKAEKLKPEKPTTVLSKPSTTTNTTSTSVPAPDVRKIRVFSNNWIIYVLMITCILSVSFAVSFWMKVVNLQGEIGRLHKLCSGNHDHRYKEDSDIEDSDSPLYFVDSDNRIVVLYSAVFVLMTPFLLFKYIDLLRLKSLSKVNKSSEEEVPLKKRIAYRVDVFFSVYPYAKLLALLLATILLIGFGGLALHSVSDGSLAEAFWLSWTFVADSGNHADSIGIGPRVVSVSISSGGMLIFAMMLGLVSDAISEKVDSLRKGKSEVIEKNHILILGWSDKLGSLLKQLAIANKSLGGGVVVVLAERDKEEMELDIAKLEFCLLGTSVICRSGSPLILADLKKVSVSKARAIIVLASDENADQSDARALRVVLSLTGVREGLSGHVVVEMSDLDNEPLVKLVGGELIETVVAHDVIGRLMIQCALQPGLAQIWEDILGFENAEFYIKRWPQLDGLRFEDVLISFSDAIPCGIKVASNGGKIILNPHDDYVLKDGDEVLVIAEDDDTYTPGPLPEVRRGIFPSRFSAPKYPEKILFCGWRRDIDDMIMVLEAFLPPGSELWMFNDVPEIEREKKLTDGGLDLFGLVNIKLVHRVGNAVIRRNLESLPLETFDSMSLSRTQLCILIHVLLQPFFLSVIFSQSVYHLKKQVLLYVILDSLTVLGSVKCNKLQTSPSS